MGEDNITGASAPYTHTLGVTTNAPYLSGETFEDSTSPTESKKALGGKASRLLIKCAVGAEVSAEFSVISDFPEEELTPGTPATLDSSNIYEYNQFDISLNSVTYEDIAESAEIEITRSQTPIDNLQGTVYAVADGGVECLLNITLRPTNNNIYTLLKDGTEFSSTISIIEEVSNHELVFTLPKCKIFTLDEAIEEDVIKESFAIDVLGTTWTAVVKDAIDYGYCASS